jgi:hypothetical protein
MECTAEVKKGYTMSDNRAVMVARYFNSHNIQFPDQYRVGVITADADVNNPGEIIPALEERVYSDMRDALIRATELRDEENPEYGITSHNYGALTGGQISAYVRRAKLKLENSIGEQPNINNEELIL